MQLSMAVQDIILSGQLYYLQDYIICRTILSKRPNFNQHFKQMNKYKKKNTFTHAPSFPQIVAYIIFLLETITFFVIIQARYMSQIVKIIMIVLYSISSSAQFISTLICSLVDPSDTFMIQYRNNRESTAQQDVSNMLYCDICQSYVKSTSRHCRICSRCVEGFDHHCIWINNCVGQRNYTIFFIMIISTLVTLVLYIISVSLLWGQQLWQEYLSSMIVVWCVACVVIIFSVLIFNLILFHVYLHCKDITTYDFVMTQREEQKAKKLQIQRKNNKMNKTQEKLKPEKQQIAVELQDENIRGSKQDHCQDKSHQNNRHINDPLIYDIGNSQKTLQKHPQKKLQHRSQILFDKRQEYSSGLNDDEIHSSKSSDHRLSQFFTRNKSLQILVNSDAILPTKYSEHKRLRTKNRVQQQQIHNYESLSMTVPNNIHIQSKK